MERKSRRSGQAVIVLAILQNQWFEDPRAVQRMYDERPHMRNRLIARFLFMGCLTGRRLRKAFGDLCNGIIWEEASPKVGAFSGSRYPADTEHIIRAIQKHGPDLILCFGQIASEGVKPLALSIPVLYGPHPASRMQGTTPALNAMAQEVGKLMSSRFQGIQD
jgi:hypothetical protein